MLECILPFIIPNFYFRDDVTQKKSLDPRSLNEFTQASKVHVGHHPDAAAAAAAGASPVLDHTARRLADSLPAKGCDSLVRTLGRRHCHLHHHHRDLDSHDLDRDIHLLREAVEDRDFEPSSQNQMTGGEGIGSVLELADLGGSPWEVRERRRCRC